MQSYSINKTTQSSPKQAPQRNTSFRSAPRQLKQELNAEMSQATHPQMEIEPIQQNVPSLNPLPKSDWHLETQPEKRNMHPETISITPNILLDITDISPLSVVSIYRDFDPKFPPHLKNILFIGTPLLKNTIHLFNHLHFDTTCLDPIPHLG